MDVSSQVAAQLLVRLCTSESEIARSARAFEPQIKRLFLRAVKNAQDAISIEAVAEMVTIPGTGATEYELKTTIDAYIETLTDEPITSVYSPFRGAKKSLKKLPNALQAAYTSGGRIGAQPIGMAFDKTNELAIEWARHHAATLVGDLKRQALDSVRAVITEGLEHGITPQRTAETIRATIGLTERDALAVMRRQITLLSKGVTEKRATKRANTYASTLLRKRAETIAIHETITASNEGQRAAWHQAVRRGLLDGTERKTILQADPCPICTVVAGEIVGVMEEFSIGLPPFHVRCKCTEGLV